MTVHVFATMGTVVSIRSREGALTDSDLRAVERIFEHYDREFSLYDPHSALSRIASGEGALTLASADVRDAYALAIDWRNSTGGFFTPHRPDGVIDLSGVVKALAIRDAGDRLDETAADWLLAVGGDILGRGERGAHLQWEGCGVSEGRDPLTVVPWRVGIADPRSREALLGVAELDVHRRALATSGTAERGEHIWRRQSTGVVQATVAAGDMVTADVLATALVAGDELERVAAEVDVDALVVFADGRMRATGRAQTWLSG